KGVQKAFNRLPHMVKSAAGSVESTVDEEYKQMETYFNEVEASIAKLLENAKKFKESSISKPVLCKIVGLLEHQASFASVIKDVFQPLPSDEGMAVEIDEKKRLDACDMATKYIGKVNELKSSLENQNTFIEENVISVLAQVLTIMKPIKEKMKKRSHKLVDYDRHRLSYQKMKSNSTSSPVDERKLAKQQQLLDESKSEYDQYNNVLKTDLPVFFQLREELMKPILESIFCFQKNFFDAACSYL
ncbi:BAR-domain-containing protein, partial [Rozella allomycis CSF55]